MLAGIKVGKKKKQQQQHAIQQQQQQRVHTAAAAATSTTNLDPRSNEVAAEEMRRSLLLMKPSKEKDSIPAMNTSTTVVTNNNNPDDSRKRTLEQHHHHHHHHHHHQQQQQQQEQQQQQRIFTTTTTKNEVEMSVLDLLKQEKTISHQQQEREMYRQVIRKKKREGSFNNDDDDDDEFQYQSHLHTSKYSVDTEDDSAKDRTKKAFVTTTANAATYQNSNRNKTTTTTSSSLINTTCFWWIQSSNFASHRVINLAELISKNQNAVLRSSSSSSSLVKIPQHITLCLVPISHAVIHGEHFYIVPIQYTPSLSTCDNEVWEEIRTVQSILQSIALKRKKGVIFFETYLGASTTSSKNKSTTTIWQARMEAIFVPINQYEDAPIYFRSAFNEQLDEYGSSHHHKSILTTTPMKPLHHIIPKNVAYFYVECNTNNQNVAVNGQNNNHNGHVLLIDESKKFPSSFGVDVIASILDIEPIRLRRRGQHTTMTQHDERLLIERFIQQGYGA